MIYMARDLCGIISGRRDGSFDPPIFLEGSDDAFVNLVSQPIYKIIHNEAAKTVRKVPQGTSYLEWRNYGDLNEYFW
jgi:hypothetical protein